MVILLCAVPAWRRSSCSAHCLPRHLCPWSPGASWMVVPAGEVPLLYGYCEDFSLFFTLSLLSWCVRCGLVFVDPVLCSLFPTSDSSLLLLLENSHPLQFSFSIFSFQTLIRTLSTSFCFQHSCPLYFLSPFLSGCIIGNVFRFSRHQMLPSLSKADIVHIVYI